MCLSKGVILSGVARRRLLTDSNLEKFALRGCRRGKGNTTISQAKGQINFFKTMLRDVLFTVFSFTAIQKGFGLAVFLFCSVNQF